MNKNAIIIISIGALAFITALFYIYFRQAINQQALIEDAMEANQDQMVDPMQEEINRTSETELRSGVNENEIVYTVTSGEAIYGASKEFLGRESEEVLGTTTDIQGTGYWNMNTNEIEVSASVNLATLTSSNAVRDREIQPLFTDKVASFRIEPTVVDIEMGNNFETEMSGTMIINGISQEVTFNTTGVITESAFNVRGEATINMSAFGVNPPSIAGVYSVADELPITISISGESSNN